MTLALVAMATAGSGASPQGPETQAAEQIDVPEGPSIDFCPTQEQMEAHLEKYGFDYKPTVPCGENGQELTPQPGEQPEPVSQEELYAAEKQALLTATRAPDVDGNPLTMEIILANGTRKTIFIDGDPAFFKDMTPSEFAEIVYP